MTDRKPPFASVEEALEDIRAGRMIVLVDDEDRENEGDLTMAAEKVTPEAINFMTKFGRGLICLALTEQRCDALNLAPITPRNTSAFGTPFCEPIDARRGTTTGTSASDRATTILAATDPNTRPEDLARPGHVYTLRARNRELTEFCRVHGMKLLTVADLIRYRMQHERYVRRIAESILPTPHGNFRMIAYSSDVDHELHVALVRGDVSDDAAGGPPLVRVHSHCLTCDVFSSTACDCRAVIDRSLAAIAEADRGVFVYLHHTGRGFQIDSREPDSTELPRIRFHQREELDHDLGRQRLVQRESGIGAQILIDLGLRRIRVLTNHPRKVVALQGYGLEIADQVPLSVDSPKSSHQIL